MPKQPRMDSPDELLDLVDANDQVIGTIKREQILDLELDHKGFVRTVGVFLVNKDGKIWLPIRQSHKKIAPNGYDFSASGHIGAGQSIISAAMQELNEELNVSTSEDDLVYVGTTTPFTGLPYFGYVYMLRFDIDPIFNHDDFSDGDWIDATEALLIIQSGHPAKDILAPSLELLINHQKP